MKRLVALAVVGLGMQALGLFFLYAWVWAGREDVGFAVIPGVVLPAQILWPSLLIAGFAMALASIAVYRHGRT